MEQNKQQQQVSTLERVLEVAFCVASAIAFALMFVIIN